MISWQLLISAFGLGLLSSFHCVGMCGAIAFSLPVQNKTSAQKVVAILLYNFGRITAFRSSWKANLYCRFAAIVFRNCGYFNTCYCAAGFVSI